MNYYLNTKHSRYNNFKRKNRLEKYSTIKNGPNDSDKTVIRKTFTLIELLVVVAIISILMSILLPGLQKAKKVANATTCKGNIRQIGMLFNNYSSDYNSFYPAPEVDHTKGYYWSNFLYSIYLSKSGLVSTGIDSYEENLKYNGAYFTNESGTIFHCPSQGGAIDSSGNPSQGPLSYAMSRHLCSSSGTEDNYSNNFKNTKVIISPSHTYIAMDSEARGYITMGSWRYWKGAAMVYSVDVHYGRRNILYHDIHVDLAKADAIPSYFTWEERQGPFWTGTDD